MDERNDTSHIPTTQLASLEEEAVGLGGYLMMDLSYACIPIYHENLIRVCREPFIDGYLETYEYGLKNTYGKGTLGVGKINMVRDDENYPHVFFTGVGSLDS